MVARAQHTQQQQKAQPQSNSISPNTHLSPTLITSLYFAMRLLSYTALALAYYVSSTTAANIPDTFRWIAADDNDTSVSYIPVVESPIMSEEETGKKVLLPTNPRTIRSKSGKPNVSSSMSMSMPTKTETVTSSSKSAEITDASSTITSSSSMSMSMPGSDGVGTKEKCKFTIVPTYLSLFFASHTIMNYSHDS